MLLPTQGIALGCYVRPLQGIWVSDECCSTDHRFMDDMDNMDTMDNGTCFPWAFSAKSAAWAFPCSSVVTPRRLGPLQALFVGFALGGKDRQAFFADLDLAEDA